MAKKKKNKPPKPQAVITNEVPKADIPRFEIGRKGDEFDRAYSRVAHEKTADADRLLRELSRESKADKFNFLDAVLPLLLIVFVALTFGVVARGDIEELFTVSFNKDTMLDGSYTAQLDKVYSDTLPFGEEIAYIGSFFGFGEQEKPTPDVEPEPEEILPEELPVVTEPAVTEPTVTTPPETTTTVTTTTQPEPTSYLMEANADVNVRAEPSSDSQRLGHLEKGERIEVLSVNYEGWATVIYNGETAYVYAGYLDYVGEETTEVTEPAPETTEMYAISTVNIRLEPSTDSAILGYFVVNEPVAVIEIGEDGWAKIYYNGMTAYVYAEYLGDEPIPMEEPEDDETEEEVSSDEEEEILPEEGEEEPAVTEAPEEDEDVTDTAEEEEIIETEEEVEIPEEEEAE